MTIETQPVNEDAPATKRDQAAHEETSATKRRKKDPPLVVQDKEYTADAIRSDPNLNFQVRITQPTSLKSLIENISHIVSELEIVVEESEAFTGIRIEMLDDNRVCMVVAKMPCDVYVNPKWATKNTPDFKSGSFCVNSEAMLLVMRQVDAQYTVDISQDLGGDRILCRSCEYLTQADVLTCRIKTLCPKNNGTVKLKNVEVSFDIVMQLHMMRSVIKMCNEINAPDVMFKITETNVNGTVYETFTMEADGSRLEMKRDFVSVRNEDGTITMDEGSSKTSLPSFDGEVGNVVFQEAYSTKYMNNFLRSMSRTTVELKLSPGQPLFCTYPLGGRDSSVTFILAPKNEDSA